MSDKRDIKITITNYIPEDEYIINLYKEGSVIPVVTKNVAQNEGNVYYFRSLPVSIYNVEVIHRCVNGATNVDTKKAYDPLVNVCECSPGWLPNEDATKCVRIINQSPIVSGVALNVAAGPNEAAYGREGLIVYAPGFLVNGKGAVAYASGTNHVYWASQNDSSKGRLNIAGVWNGANAMEPYDTWIGFSAKVMVPESKIYYVAFAGDNYVRVKLNGILVVNQQLDVDSIVNRHFNYWHCYPIFLNAGENIIQLEGLNDSSQGCFAAEIYNCELSVMQNVTPVTETNLNRIFSTLDMIGGVFTNNYSCNEGYALDISNPVQPVCKKIEYMICGV